MAVTVTPQRRRVELARPVPVALDAAVAALEQDPRGVIGVRLQAPMVAGVTYTKLGVEVLGGHQVVRDVRIGFGRLIEDEDAMALPVWWEDADYPDRFPTFDGGLELRPAPSGTELRLAGSYQPPLAAFGRFADGVVGHRVVAASLEAFLAAAAQRLLLAAGNVSPDRP